jgi:hypothetical protein
LAGAHGFPLRIGGLTTLKFLCPPVIGLIFFVFVLPVNL